MGVLEEQHGRQFSEQVVEQELGPDWRLCCPYFEGSTKVVLQEVPLVVAAAEEQP